MAVRIHRWTDKRLELQAIHLSLYPSIGGSVEISLLLLLLLVVVVVVLVDSLKLVT